MKSYKNKYRVESSRLKEWDYSTAWWYFITICTKDHIEYFGEIVKEKMILNNLGIIVEKYWKEIPIHFPNVGLDYFVIMPNHIHGIIILNEKGRDVACNVSTNVMSRISPKKGSLSTLIRSFKSAVTKTAKEKGYINFQWQSRFYDRIIRNEKELYKIRKYLLQNPLKWDLGKNIPENMNF